MPGRDELGATSRSVEHLELPVGAPDHGGRDRQPKASPPLPGGAAVEAIKDALALFGRAPRSAVFNGESEVPGRPGRCHGHYGRFGRPCWRAHTTTAWYFGGLLALALGVAWTPRCRLATPG
jgi:hypothetical protein